MTDDQNLDRLSDVLTGPPSAHELAAGSVVVGEMAQAMRPMPRGNQMSMKFMSRKVATIAGAVVFGTATAAAAATGNLPLVEGPERPELIETIDDTVELQPAAVTEAVSSDGGVEPAADVADEIETGPVGPDGEPYGDVPCDEAETHGEYVSSVAQDDAIEGNRGQIVSQAAKTDCGKADKPDKPEKAEKGEHDDEDDAADDGAADDAGPGNSGNGNGNKGNGNKGNGKGNGGS